VLSKWGHIKSDESKETRWRNGGFSFYDERSLLLCPIACSLFGDAGL